jgi:hypothetical protein
MTKLSSRRSTRVAISGTAIVMPLAFGLAGCGGSPTAAPAPAGSASAGSPSAASRTATSPAASPTGVTAPAVSVPKYVASENARQEVTTTSCRHDGRKGWLLKGTVTNSTSSARSYSIVVDFVSHKGDTVLDTKVVHVRRTGPGARRHWSATGAAGHVDVTCVIRQALGQPQQ